MTDCWFVDNSYFRSPSEHIPLQLLFSLFILFRCSSYFQYYYLCLKVKAKVLSGDNANKFDKRLTGSSIIDEHLQEVCRYNTALHFNC